MVRSEPAERPGPGSWLLHVNHKTSRARKVLQRAALIPPYSQRVDVVGGDPLDVEGADADDGLLGAAAR